MRGRHNRETTACMRRRLLENMGRFGDDSEDVADIRRKAEAGAD